MPDPISIFLVLAVFLGALSGATFAIGMVVWAILFILTNGRMMQPTRQSIVFAAKFTGLLVVIGTMSALPVVFTDPHGDGNWLIYGALVGGVLGLVGGVCLHRALKD